MAKKKVAKKKAAKKKVAAKLRSSDYSDIPEGLKYPWNNAGRLWNILWMIIPIIGWLALLGYVKKIVQTIVAGDKSGLPKMGKFGDSLVEGFWAFVKLIPLMIVLWVIALIPILGNLAYWFLAIFFVPYLIVHFFVTGDFAATFDYMKVVDHVFGNIKEYVIAYVKSIVFWLVYWVLSFVLIGIPCLHFGGFYFIAEFYAKNN